MKPVTVLRTTAEADLPSFLSGVLAAIRLEKRSKHLFLLGKQWSKPFS